MKDFSNYYEDETRRRKEAQEEAIRRQRHLQDIAEGKEDTQGVVLEKDKKISELEKEIIELKKRLLII
ncbi:hypothetical protein [Clostridium ganghwense]|uniref:Uncharacterized protein n=1 Tax=Clostridium ganghwense TaxID=312089 RepID=A0ABT4CUR2_9CLOT|nr:hypothetical protein [Clostridium ganghwense]MCY6372772.1 hypothetical protein [Clostridium ganghwense]